MISSCYLGAKRGAFIMRLKLNEGADSDADNGDSLPIP